MHRRVRWRGLEIGASEVCTFDAGPAGVRITGQVKGRLHVEYEAVLSPDWLFRELTLQSEDRALAISRTDDGWTVDGAERPDLREARDIDLCFSPSTNTLPIRRLQLEIGHSAELITAYVSPDLSVQPDPQRYTREASSVYLYESLDSDFSRHVTVDADGLVVDYPGLFSRAGG